MSYVWIYYTPGKSKTKYKIIYESTFKLSNIQQFIYSSHSLINYNLFDTMSGSGNGHGNGHDPGEGREVEVGGGRWRSRYS